MIEIYYYWNIYLNCYIIIILTKTRLDVETWLCGRTNPYSRSRDVGRTVFDLNNRTLVFFVGLKNRVNLVLFFKPWSLHIQTWPVGNISVDGPSCVRAASVVMRGSIMRACVIRRHAWIHHACVRHPSSCVDASNITMVAIQTMWLIRAN